MARPHSDPDGRYCVLAIVILVAGKDRLTAAVPQGLFEIAMAANS